MASIFDKLGKSFTTAFSAVGSSINPFFSPLSRLASRAPIRKAGEFLAPETTRRVTEAKSPLGRLGAAGLIGPGVAQEVFLQPLARTFGSFGLSATGQTRSAVPEGRLQEFFLGKEPVRPFQDIIRSGQLGGEAVGRKLFPGAPAEVAGITGLLGAVGLGALEASSADLGFGALGKKAAKQVAKKTLGEFVQGAEQKVARELIDTIGINQSRIVARDISQLKGGKATGRTLLKTLDSIESTARRSGEVLPTGPVTRLGRTAVTEGPTSPLLERGFVTSAKELLPEAREISGVYTRRNTQVLAQKAANLVKDDILKAERFALTGTGEESVATAAELLKHYSRAAAKTTDEAVRDALFTQAAKIANTVAERLTEQGRIVQAASILGKLTPEGQVRFAAREIQKFNEKAIKLGKKPIPELTGEQVRKITEEMKIIERMPDGIEKAMKFQELQKFISSLVPSPLMLKLSSIWKAGLLTGIKTSGLNIFSNLSHTTSEIIKDVPASGFDALFGLVTGKRTTVATLRGLLPGTKEGAEKGFRYLKTGFDERNIAAKLDYKPVNFKNKMVKGYVEGVFRLLGAEDQPFYYGALRRSLNNQAIAEAKNKGLKGTAREKFIKELVQNPTDQMSIYSLLDAETAVFQQRTALGEAGTAIKRAVPSAEFIMPFSKTPSGVAMQVLNYTPVGAVKEIVQQIGRKRFDQRLMSQALGRSTVGVVPLYLGAELLKNNLINLDYPVGERERELWKAEGRKPNTIKIGDKWRSVHAFGPAGVLLLVGGQFFKALKKTGSQSEAIVQAIFSTLKSFTEQTFLKGTNDVLAALTDPERNVERVSGSFISSFVPTIINDIARSTDPKERRPENVFQRIQARIPQLRQSLPPQVDILGREVERIGNPLEVLIDPTRPSKADDAPILKEFRRLMDAGFTISPTALGDKKGFDGLTQEQNTKIWRVAGSIVNDKVSALIKLDEYQKLDDEDKAKIIDKFVSKAKLNARVGAVLNFTEDMEGEELKQELSKLKASGLLNKEVLAEYLKLR